MRIGVLVGIALFMGGESTMSRAIVQNAGHAYRLKAQVLKEKVYPADIARMVLFLASDDSRLLSAQNFVVDGGRM